MSKQKRSENTYQKINTIFKRDSKDLIIVGDYSDKIVEFLKNCVWLAFEKIDGTNIRLEVTIEIVYSEANEEGIRQILGVKFNVDYKGKTDNAQIPPTLRKHLEDNYPPEKVLAAWGLKSYIPYEEWKDHKWEIIDDIPTKWTIYGEGYGAGIQSGGGYIRNGVSFIVFDSKVDNLYLEWNSTKDIAEKLKAPTVPFIGKMTIEEAIDVVSIGFKSTIAEDKNLDAEGLVLRPEVPIYDRMGNRVITKIKTVDFRKLKAANSK